MTQTESILDKARQNIEKGNFTLGWNQLVISFQEDSDCKETYELAARCLANLKGGEAAARLFDTAIAQFDSSRAFCDLGWHFVGAFNDHAAMAMFRRAFHLVPGQTEAGVEMAAALCAIRQPEKAREVLRQCNLSDFWVGYQYYWASLLCGISDDVEAFVKAARPRKVPFTKTSSFRMEILDKMDEFRTRLETLGHPESQIRDWHFIQYGAAILNYNYRLSYRPIQRDGELLIGVDNSSTKIIEGGRFVQFAVPYPMLQETLNKLKMLLDNLGRNPQFVLSLPDRDSRIIAQGVANVFDLPLIMADSNVDQEASLLVAANSHSLWGVKCQEVRRNQTVFSFNLDWLYKKVCTPDIAGVMSYSCKFPWQEDFPIFNTQTNQPEIDPETKRPRLALADNRSPEEIAGQFSSKMSKIPTRPGEMCTFDELLEFYRKNAPLLKGGEFGGNRRWTFMKDSPIASEVIGSHGGYVRE